MLRPQVIQHVHNDLLAPLDAMWCTASSCPLTIYLVPSDLWREEVSFICYEIVKYHFLGRTSTVDGIETLPVCRSKIEQIEVDDMATEVIQGPPSSPTQEASFAKKVQTIILRFQPSRRHPQEHISNRGAHKVKREASRLPGRGARHGHTDLGHEVEHVGASHLVDPFDSSDLDIPSFSLGLTPPSQSLPGGSGTLRASPPPGLGFTLFQSPYHTFLGFSSFRAPPPPGTAGSSTPHQHISHSSLSDEEERTNDTTHVQHLGFEHRIGKKTTRFTPSDWP
ncbi:hypothetical protein M9H77_31000 [Catharanthus roseus]|uniref:Uncharacterized protein n=1 Tax=Catharanthus roseus TaxID=4058 RepID=A0ACC0A343_CATRO|nr:hypothetical protein M9H77_31000 [Catharanthus roseus]